MVLLTAQLSHTRQPALALAGGASMWGSSAVAESPSLYSTSSAASWANDWDAPIWGNGVLRDGDAVAASNAAQSSAVHPMGATQGLNRWVLLAAHVSYADVGHAQAQHSCCMGCQRENMHS